MTMLLYKFSVKNMPALHKQYLFNSLLSVCVGLCANRSCCAPRGCKHQPQQLRYCKTLVLHSSAKRMGTAMPTCKPLVSTAKVSPSTYNAQQQHEGMRTLGHRKGASYTSSKAPQHIQGKRCLRKPTKQTLSVCRCARARC